MGCGFQEWGFAASLGFSRQSSGLEEVIRYREHAVNGLLRGNSTNNDVLRAGEKGDWLRKMRATRDSWKISARRHSGGAIAVGPF